ncbi:Nucleoside phosphatase GDA1/CD39 [Mycena indigotica]|uniref:guanosine-diphosphatase n=1 Tax=Mycena indigotica TaxID=2126181 RepID=A0A8H6SW61_9AGAR|nr:Nucleoside phosphatase GDA1/CD39 [Mycena indigotica]KAF7306240.1 Nucleoside phosphatase GDA1/CD39 [Mycena indigotica]
MMAERNVQYGPSHSHQPLGWGFWRNCLLLGLWMFLSLDSAAAHLEGLLVEQNDAFSPSDPSPPTPSVRYAVVIEGGSTGTRLHIHAFSVSSRYLSTAFYRNAAGSGSLPSLHTYSERPEDVTKSLGPLIEHALDAIPATQHACTPLFMRASAGIRLLSPPHWDGLLSSVEKFLRDSSVSPFPVPHDGVGIMEPGEDMMYAWIAARHLLQDSNDVAILSLGGGNAEVVFEPSVGFDDYKYSLRLGNRTHDVYRRTFDHTGLHTLRQQVYSHIVGVSHDARISNPCIAKGKTEYATLYPGVYEGGTYIMDGTAIGDYEACTTIVDTMLAPTFDNANILIIDPRTQIWLMWYYTDRIQPLLTEEDDLQTITVGKIAGLAQTVCAGPEAWADVWGASKIVDRLSQRPSWCLDLTIIHRVLTNGFRLEAAREVMVGRSVAKTEPHWTIGAAMQLMQNTPGVCR